jgi:M6 family metalloprotease-like protein
MRKLFVLATLLLLGSRILVEPLFAVTAYPYPVQITQRDGTLLTIIMQGDEKVKWAKTLDGYTLVYNSKGVYEYASLDAAGDLIPSGIKATEVQGRSLTELSFLAKTPKSLFFSASQVSIMKQAWNTLKSGNPEKAFPTTGSRKLLCILIGFTDLAFTKTQTDFQNLFNQVSYSVDGATGSVKDFFWECSYNQLSLAVDVAGPFTASNTMAYYGANVSGIRGNDIRPRELVTEAVNLANPTTNYADYDNDGDGTVDGIYVIFAGYGEEYSGVSTDAIWSHAWSIPTVTLDGKTISRYSCSPELRGNSGTGLTRIGVICHEFGHVLGAPDFYDTDYTDGGQFSGTGQWDLQANGSWNNGGTTPAQPNPYTKIYVYSWASVTTVSSQANLTLLNAAQNSNSFYRFNTTTTGEYFLMENRQQVGFDTYLPGHGLLIFHVHKDISSYGINTSHPQMMYPVCADAGTEPNSTPTSYGTINGAGCPFPGTGLKTEFTDATIPSQKSWAGALTDSPITNIVEYPGPKTVSLCFMGCLPLTPTQKDSMALVALYNNCNGAAWTKQANWLTGHIDTWQGVTVEAERVVGLNLGDPSISVGLIGTLPAELVDLTEIRDLKLFNNQLSGSLPASWSALTKLESIGLNNNLLTGSLPTEWSALVNLKFLYLNYNQLSGSLPGSWSALVNLQTLNLYFNQLTGVLPDVWSTLINLTALGLNNNQFTGAFPTSWTSMVKLVTLYLSNNQLTELPVLSTFTVLNTLVVNGNFFDFGDIEPNIGKPLVTFTYSPQGLVGEAKTIYKLPGQAFSVSVPANGTNSQYQWYKGGVLIPTASSSTYNIPAIATSDAGVYTCQITNTVATALTLTSQPVTLGIGNTNANITAFTIFSSDCGCSTGTWIDPLMQRILVKVPYTMNLTNLAPTTISVEPGATISPDPATPQNWTLGPVNYTVTATDGVTQKVWAVKVENPPCTDTNIVSWVFNNSVQASNPTFNYTSATITASLIPGTDLSTLSATVGLGCGSVITTLAGGAFPDVLDFTASNTKQFRVTAQSGISRVWTIVVLAADWTAPTVTTWNATVNNCTEYVEVQSNETGRVFIVNQTAINMAAVPYPLCNYNLADWYGSGTTSVAKMMANHLGAWTTVSVANTSVHVNTSGLFAGTYWAFAVDNAGNVSQISTVSVTLTMCDVDVADLCALRNMTTVWRYRLTGEVVVSYEETRAGGNIKYVQTATCGILLKDINSILDVTYGEGAGLTNLFGTLDFSGANLAFIPCCTAPVKSSTGNVITPVSFTWDEFFSNCHLPNSLKKCESMLVTISTPMLAYDDYTIPGHLNWLFDNDDLTTKNASGNIQYFLLSVFNSPLIGTPISTSPAYYTGIRNNVNWGTIASPMLYGLITPRKAADISLANDAVMSANPNQATVEEVMPLECKSVVLNIYNEGIESSTVTALYLDDNGAIDEFNLVSPPIPPFSVTSWTSIPVTIAFCPVDIGNATTNLVVEYGVGKKLIVPINGKTKTINSLPTCESFNSPWPVAAGETYMGWTSTPTNSTDFQNYASNAWVNYDGSPVMNMRTRKTVAGVRQTTYLITPGLQVSGSDPVISWVEAASTNAWAGPKISPRNLYVSTNGTTWTLVDSYTSATMPDAYTGGGWRAKVYSLAPYIGQVIWWKFECTSLLTTSGYEYSYWCLDNVCVSERITTPVFAKSGDGDLGKAMIPNTKQNVIAITNSGLSLLRIKSVEVIGSAFFTVSSGTTFPVDVRGTNYAWSEYPVVSPLNLTVTFAPSGSGNYNGTLRIKYGMTDETTVDIPLTGTGVACSDAAEAFVGRNWAPSQDTWFKYTADKFQMVTITSCDINQQLVGGEYAWDTFLNVYSDCAGTLIASNDDTETGCTYNRASSSVTIAMAGGETVYIAWPLAFPTSGHSADGFYFNINPTYPIDGDICETAIPMTLPIVNYSGTTTGFNDDYNQSPCSPAQNYMDGNDVVYTITLAEAGTLAGSIVGVFASVHILSSCPSHVLLPSDCKGFAAGPTGGAFSSPIDAGTYYVVVSSWAPPQTVDFILNLEFTANPDNVPDWTVDVRKFAFDGEVTSEVFVDELPVTEGDGILGAFVGDECRGVKVGGELGPTGKYIFVVRCYSNIAAGALKVAGEQLSFRYYHPQKDTILNIDETVLFVDNMTVGDAQNPMPLNAYTTIIVSRQLSTGWSWFSLNVENAVMTPDLVLSSLTHKEGDYVKNQTVSATYYNGYGWFGELTTMDPKEMYKIKLVTGSTLTYEGTRIDPSTKPITISTGWNWIGYLPQTAQPVANALASINPVNNDYIKDQVASSTYYTGFGWFGEMTDLVPLGGYMLKTSHAGTLTYTNGTPVNVTGVTGVKDVRSVKDVKLLDPVTGHSSLVTDYEYSGQVTATVYLNGENYAGEDYCLYSMVEGRVRGVSRGMWFEPGKEWIHNHLTYSNFNDGDTIRFRLYDSKSDNWYQFEEFVVFKADMLISNALNPFLLKSSSLLHPSPLTLNPSLEVWPNPAGYFATIKYSIATNQPVVIQVIDFAGRVVDELEQGTQKAGEHVVSWDTGALDQGVYHIRLKNSQSVYKQVVITR